MKSDLKIKLKCVCEVYLIVNFSYAIGGIPHSSSACVQYIKIITYALVFKALVVGLVRTILTGIRTP